MIQIWGKKALSAWQKNADTSLSQSDKMPIVHVNNRDICHENHDKANLNISKSVCPFGQIFREAISFTQSQVISQ